MAGFEDTLALFGINDPAISAISPGRAPEYAGIAAPEYAGASAQSTEDADASTPSAEGNVLASLTRRGTPEKIIPQSPLARSQRGVSGGFGQGIGGDISAGMAAYNPALGPWNALASGAATIRHGEEAAAQADLFGLMQKKQAFDQYAKLFELGQKGLETQISKAKASATERHQIATEAETKRLHDIYAGIYSGKEEAGPTDWALPKNQLTAMRLQKEKAAELGLDPVTVRKVEEQLRGGLLGADQEKALRDSLANARTQYGDWLYSQPWMAGKKKPAAPPQAAPDATKKPEEKGFLGKLWEGIKSIGEDVSTPATGPAELEHWMDPNTGYSIFYDPKTKKGMPAGKLPQNSGGAQGQ